VDVEKGNQKNNKPLHYPFRRVKRRGSSALLQGNLLGARQATGEELAGHDRARIRLLSGSRKSLHRPKDFSHPLGVIGEEHGNLGADNGLVRASPCGPLLPGNCPPTSLQHELVEVLTPHELHHLGTERLLTSPKILGLRRQSPKLIV